MKPYGQKRNWIELELACKYYRGSKMNPPKKVYSYNWKRRERNKNKLKKENPAD